MTGVQVAIPEKTTKVSFRQDVAPWIPQLQEVCFRGMEAEGIVAAALHVGLKNPQIFDCEPKSIFLALAKCARLGLYPGGGMALVPLKNSIKQNGRWEEVLQLEAWTEYQGLKALAIRQKLVTMMEEFPVYSGDDFEHQFGLDAYLRHRPAGSGKRGVLSGAYSIIRLPNRERTFHYMDLADIEEIRSKSRTWGPKKVAECPPWYAMKTVVRDYLGRQPKEGALQEAMAMDDTVPPALVDPETGEVLESGEMVAALTPGDAAED